MNTEENNNNINIVYRCRKCRLHLDVNEAVVKSPTDSGLGLVTTIDLDTDKCPDWILDTINKTGWSRGKINCVKCSGRLGSFDFLKVHSRLNNNGNDKHSAVHLLQDRVDTINSSSPVHSVFPASSACKSDVNRQPQSAATSSVLASPMSSDLVQARSDMNNQGELDARCTVPSNVITNDERIQAVDDGGKFNTAPLCDTTAIVCDINKSSTITCDSTFEKEMIFDKEHFKPSAYNTNRICASSLYDSSFGDVRFRKHFKVRRRFTRSIVDSEGNQQSSSRHVTSQLSDLDVDDCGSRFEALVNEDVHLEEEDVLQSNLSMQPHVEEEIAVELSCPICLELLYSAYKCRPCDHVFCEICLRKVANHQPGNTRCPLCRKLINICVQDAGLNNMLKTRYPKQYKERRLEARKMKTKNFPLPRCSMRAVTTRNIRHVIYDRYFWDRLFKYLAIIVVLLSIPTGVLILLLYVVKLFISSIWSLF